MKRIRNKNYERGFTLIELLAVIVVLAIVLLMGASAVIPRMNEARKQVLALEANEAIESTTMYLQNNTYTGGKTFPVSENTVVCVTIKELIDSGDYSGDRSKYDGRVLVKRKSAGSSLYLYVVDLSNGTLMVHEKGLNAEKNANKDIVANDVVDFSSTTFQNTCPTDTSSLLSAFKVSGS